MIQPIISSYFNQATAQKIDRVEFWLRHWQRTRQLLDQQVLDARPFVRELQIFCNPLFAVDHIGSLESVPLALTSDSETCPIKLAPETWIMLESELLLDEAQAAAMGYDSSMDMIMGELMKLDVREI